MFGNHPVPMQGAESHSPPPAFASEPLVHASGTGDKTAASTARPANLDILEIDGYGSGTSSLPNHEPDFMKNTSPTGVRIFYIFILLWLFWFIISHTFFCPACNHTKECNA